MLLGVGSLLCVLTPLPLWEVQSSGLFRAVACSSEYRLPMELLRNSSGLEDGRIARVAERLFCAKPVSVYAGHPQAFRDGDTARGYKRLNRIRAAHAPSKRAFRASAPVLELANGALAGS